MKPPTKEPQPRISVSLRIPELLYDRLKAAAAERDVSVNFLVNRAVEEFLLRMLPPGEIQWTKTWPAVTFPVTFQGWWEDDDRKTHPEPWETFMVMVHGAEAGDWRPLLPEDLPALLDALHAKADDA